MNPLIAALSSIAAPVIDRFFPDKTKAQEFAQAVELEMLRNQNTINSAQAEVNKVEASSDDWFVRRWRPFIGWICGVSMASNFVVMPLLKAFCAAAGSPITLEPLDMGEMMPVLIGMLGLGGMRTFEKVNKATQK